MADERHPHRPERPEVQVVASAVARRHRVRDETGGRGRQARDRLVEEAGRLEPPDEIAAGHPARRPGGLPAREDDVAAGLPELLGELAARLAAPHDEHRPGWKAGLVPVLLEEDPQEPGRQRLGSRRVVRALEGAGGEDDAGRAHVAEGRPGEEPARLPVDRRDVHALPDGEPGGGGVSLEVRDDLVAGHEAVGVVAGVGPARESHRPVRGDEAEAVPAVSPRLADPAALQDEMVDPQARELVADRESGRPAAHDEDVDADHGRAV